MKHLEELVRNNVNLISVEFDLLKRKNQAQIGMSGKRSAQIKLILSVENFCEENYLFELLKSGHSTHLTLKNRGMSEIDRRFILTQMTVMDLSYNRLTTLPSDIIRCTNLGEINLSNNQLAEVPEVIGQCHFLRILNFSNNHLTELPKSLLNLKDLTWLSVAQNKLTSLPDWIISLGKLSTFLCAQNKIKGIPKEILAQGGEAVMLYLNELKRGKQKCYRMKLMAVGAANVGKTSLLRQLTTKEIGALQSIKKSATKRLVKDSMNVATDGIQISELKLRSQLLPQGAVLQFSCWDFAGQEVYYATHSFFLSDRAIYLVVLKLGDYQTKILDYWLHSVEAHAGDSPILIVGTHADEVSPAKAAETGTEILERYYKRFPSICGFLGMSSFDGSGVTELTEQIIKVALKQPYIPEFIPKPLLTLEETIRSRKEISPIQSWSDFSKMALDVGLNEKSLDYGTQFLHDIGALSYFPQVDKSVVILDPQWLIDMFAAIFTLTSNYVTKGLLMRSHLIHIWRPPCYPISIHPYLIQLLAKFELLHRIKKSSQILPSESLPLSPLQNSSPSTTSPSSLPPGRTLRGEKREEEKRMLTQFASKRDKERENHHQNASDVFLLPTFLPGLDVVQLRRHWQPFSELVQVNQWVSSDVGTLQQLGRYYELQFLPTGFFSRIMVRLLNSTSWRPVYFWNEGIVVSEDTSTLSTPSLSLSPTISSAPLPPPGISSSSTVPAIPTALAKEGSKSLRRNAANFGKIESQGKHFLLLRVEGYSVQMFIRGPCPKQFIGIFADQLDTIFMDVFQAKVETFVPCTHCMLQKQLTEENLPTSRERDLKDTLNKKSVYLFPLCDIERVVAQNRPFVLCEGITPVECVLLAPDIALANFADSVAEISDIEKGEMIGVGGYASVYLSKWNGQDVALKVLDMSKKSALLEVFTEFRREATFMQSLKHKNIVALHAIVLDPFCLVLEYMNRGNLYEFVRSPQIKEDPSSFTWQMRVGIALDIAEGMNFLHSIHFIHRDLKSPNVLLTDDPLCEYGLCAKIADFGLTRKMVLTSKLMKKGVQNPRWTAPEIIEGKEYTEKVDCYSFGVILYEMLTLKEYFEEYSFLTKLEDVLLGGGRPALPSPETVPKYWNLLRKCWQQIDSERPSFEEITQTLSTILLEIDSSSFVGRERERRERERRKRGERETKREREGGRVGEGKRREGEIGRESKRA